MFLFALSSSHYAKTGRHKVSAIKKKEPPFLVEKSLMEILNCIINLISSPVNVFNNVFVLAFPIEVPKKQTNKYIRSLFGSSSVVLSLSQS